MPNLKLPHDHGKSTEHLLAGMPDDNDCLTVADIFKQLGDSSRIKIFWLLCHCEECVINISAIVGMTSPAVSHHLKQLRDGGLVVSRREGKEVYYRASDTDKTQLLHLMLEKLMKIACPTEQRGDSD